MRMPLCAGIVPSRTCLNNAPENKCFIISQHKAAKHNTKFSI